MATIKKSIKNGVSYNITGTFICNGTSYIAKKIINNGNEREFFRYDPLSNPNITSVSVSGTSSIIVKWTDPDDAKNNQWARSLLVRKVGSAPNNASDGTQVVSTTERNKYSSSGFVNSGLASNTTYYYRIFSYDKYGNEYLSNSSSAKTPASATVEFLLVGGGGGGGGGYYRGGGGGGAGGVIQCSNYTFSGSQSVVIGAGGIGCSNGCNSSFGSLIAYGGGKGGCCQTASGGGVAGSNGASGGGGSGYHGNGGCACHGAQGCPGGCGQFCAGGGGGGATGAGQRGGSCLEGGRGGNGIQSSITGTNQCYAYGGSGGNGCRMTNGNGGGGNGGCCCYNCNGGNATSYGSGGGGVGACARYSDGRGGCGCQGIFVVRYPTACGYNITGGCKYTCGTYTIHCFTSNGTLTVN